MYNLSQAGCGPVQQVVNLHRLLDAGVKPDFVLVEVLPPLLGLRCPAEKKVVLAKLSAADLARAAPYFDDPAAAWAEWERLRATPWSTYRLGLLSHWGAGRALPPSRFVSSSALRSSMTPNGSRGLISGSTYFSRSRRAITVKRLAARSGVCWRTTAWR